MRVGILLFAQFFGLVSQEDSAFQSLLRVPDTEPEFWPSTLDSHCFGEWESGVLGVGGSQGLELTRWMEHLTFNSADPCSHPSFFLETHPTWLVFSGAQQVIIGEKNDQKKK